MKSTAIPVEGDRSFVDLLHLVAKSRGITISRLVRSALDKEYGAEFVEAKKIADSFFVQGVASMHNIEHKSSRASGE